MNESDPNMIKPLSERLYPDELAAREAELLKERRKAAGRDDGAKTKLPPRETIRDSVGLALSGGGIRSATFCLGALQELARLGWLRHVDFLSTVSGGGYIGSFLGKLIQESGSPGAAEAQLKDDQSWPVRWLRENGYYLAPGGSADKWVILALLLRNWVAVQVVLGGTLIIPFLWSAAFRRALWEWQWPGKDSWLVQYSGVQYGVSPWIILVAASASIGLILPGIVYWFTQLWQDEAKRDEYQSLFTRWAGFGLLLTCIFGLITSMETAAYWILHYVQSKVGSGWSIAAFYGTLTAGFGVLQKYAGKLTKLTKSSGPGGNSIPMTTLASAGGYLWALAFWLALALLGEYFLFWGRKKPVELVVWLSVGYTALVWLMAKVYSFVNLSSLHQYYSTRLCRAYLGASNEARKDDVIPITQPHPSDDLSWDKYAPHEAGGPLHVLNCTLNETISGKSQIEKIDRKGLSYALGPAGLTVGAEHHALWSPKCTGAKLTRNLVPIDNGRSFQVFPVEKISSDEIQPISVENLTLGDWIGISGAAFSTGMGANTQPGLSLLLGFANIRLGYWWDSGIDPASRETEATPTQSSVKRKVKAAELLQRFFAWLLPAPSSLLDELLTQYHGPARRRWYLSDGGHFENTACYELLRRRVRFILCLDCGQDELYAFEDVANLVRKARIDFNTDVEFIDGAEAKAALKFLPAPFNRLSIDRIGLPKDFHEAAMEKKAGNVSTTGERHALLAQVFYDCSGASGEQPRTAGTYILFLKPGLSGDEFEDVAQYHTARPAFPQESTADQFYNESQWESYRALGQHVANRVLVSDEAPEKPKRKTPPPRGN